MLINPFISKAFIKIKPIDFRKGMDSLIGFISQILQQDPRSGSAFVFKNSSSTSIKVLYYDEQGFWLCQKRLSQGKLIHWPKSESETLSINTRELFVVLFDGDINKVSFRPVFQKIDY